MERLGFSPRSVASSIDFLLVTALPIFLGFRFLANELQNIFQRIEDSSPEHVMDDLSMKISNIFFMLNLFILLYSLMEIFLHGTPGKLMYGIRIRDENGQPAKLKPLCIRWAIKNSPTMGMVIYSIVSMTLSDEIAIVVSWINGLITLAVCLGLFLIFTSDRQTLYDKIAHTAVYPA